MRRFPVLLAALLLASGASLAGAQATVVVPSPTSPTIQDGINNASTGDTVLVSPGTYFETLAIFGKTITLESSGGRNQTIVDASGLGRVMTLSNAAGTTVRGFTFTDGAELSGGGVGVFTPGVTIDACAITANSATGPAGNGGGLWAQSASDLLIEDTLITNNTADGSGGGILSIFTDLTIRNSDLAGNTAVDDGGGLYIEGGVHLIEGSELRSNDSAASGGGMWVTEAELVLSKTLLISNHADGEGGGALLRFPLGGGYAVHESTLMDNTADGSGGGIMGRSLSSNLDLRGSMLTDNAAGGSGGGLGLINSGTLVITESTFSNNSAGFFGGAISLSATNAIIENSILWADSALMGGSEIAVNTAGFAATVRFSDIESILPPTTLGLVVSGPGVINLDPAFAAPGVGDYRQTADSPTLDAGSLGPPPGAEDFECDPRLADSDNDGQAVVDMGADECPFLPGDVNGDASLSIADPVYLLAYLFQGGPAPVFGNGDVNGDGNPNIADPSFLLAYLFQGGAPPVCQN